MPKPERVLPIYLTTLSIQFLHFTEEYLYAFPVRITEIMAGIPEFDTNAFVTFNMIAYCLFLLAGLGIYKGTKFPMIIVWFFAIGGVVGNSILHPLLALRVGGYFPGLFTSIAYWVAGPILLIRLWDNE